MGIGSANHAVVSKSLKLINQIITAKYHTPHKFIDIVITMKLYCYSGVYPIIKSSCSTYGIISVSSNA